MTVMRDVSVSEMLHMREVQHMSNREIAEKLDCSKATVYKMIGAQPEGIRAPRRTKDKPIIAQPVVHEPFAERLAKMRGEENVTPPAQRGRAGGSAAGVRCGCGEAVPGYAPVRAEGQPRQGDDRGRMLALAA